MSQPLQPSCRNRLIKALSTADFALLHSHMSIVDIALSEVLAAPDTAVERVYFLERGIVSLIAAAADGQQIEVGLVGNEGMVGLPVLLDAGQSPSEARVQAQGQAWALSSAVLHAALRRSATLHRMLLRYAHTVETQFAYTALANGRYKLERRLARWLLMCHDRVDGDALPTTHLFLSLMLGVNRPGLTSTMARFERAGIIATKRGTITVRKREALLAVAGPVYGAPEAEYARLIAEPTQPG